MSNTFFQRSIPTVEAAVPALVLTETIEKQFSPTVLTETSNSAAGNARRGPATLQICRYFLHGICRRGARCRFSHDAIGEDVAISGSHRGNRQTFTEPLTSTISFTATSTGSSSTRTSVSQSEENYAKLAKWAEAPAFVPKNPKIISTPIDIEMKEISTTSTDELGISIRPKTWAEVVSGAETTFNNVQQNFEVKNSIDTLCPYKSPCPYGTECVYNLHWELCKMCDKYCLHPKDLEQRRKHNKECVQRHEQAMEFSFAIARSRDKVCGICLDVIMELPHNFRRFGILSQCNHVFCLACIRKWRQAQDFNHNVTRSCPQCRVFSEFVCPSSYWVETKEQKDKLINDYRATLGRKHCKYFKFGKGKCPFGNKCFYKHALPDGEVVNVGGPNRIRKLTQANRHDVRTVNLVDFCLWDFVEHRNMSCNNLDSDNFYYDSD